MRKLTFLPLIKIAVFAIAAVLTAPAFSAPLYILPLESDADSAITDLWENSLSQLFKESNFTPQKISQENFPDCADINCILSEARALGAQGLFRGRIKTEGDSINFRFRIDWLAGNSNPQSEAKGNAPLSWDNVLSQGVLLKIFSDIIGETGRVSKPALSDQTKEAIVSIETNPENAVVMLNGNTVCKSPCSFSAFQNPNLSYNNEEMAEISAYWLSGENLWAAKTVLKVGSQDTTKIYLSLKRSFASTEIRSNPSNAAVFNSQIIDVNSKPIGKTPFMLSGEPGERQVRLFYKGFRDTLLNVKLDVLEKNVIFAQLAPITDPQELAKQDAIANAMKKRQIGLGLLGGSVGILISGTVLCILAQDDYKKARNLKDELSYPSIGGENFNSKVKENNDAVKAGNAKTAFGSGLIGLSALLAGVGFAISF